MKFSIGNNTGQALDELSFLNHNDSDTKQTAESEQEAIPDLGSALVLGLPASEQPRRTGEIGRRALLKRMGSLACGAGAATLLAACGDEESASGPSPIAATATADANITQAAAVLKSTCLEETKLILAQPAPSDPRVKRAYENLAKARHEGTTLGMLALLLERYRDAVRDAKLTEPKSIHDARLARANAQINFLIASSSPSNVIAVARRDLEIDEAMLTSGT